MLPKNEGEKKKKKIDPCQEHSSASFVSLQDKTA